MTTFALSRNAGTQGRNEGQRKGSERTQTGRGHDEDRTETGRGQDRHRTARGQRQRRDSERTETVRDRTETGWRQSGQSRTLVS